jgi:hypothetical protein
MVPAIEAPGVSGVEPLQRRRQIGGRRPQEEVVVIGHQTKSKNLEVEASVAAGEKIKKIGAITIIEIDRLAIIAARGNVVDRAWKLDPPGPSHATILSRPPGLCQINCELSGSDPF